MTPLVPPAPGLGQAVAVSRAGRKTALQAGALFVAVFVFFVWSRTRGATLDVGDLVVLVAILLVGVLPVVGGALRGYCAAGPGWLKSQKLLRSEWVRTDALAEVTSRVTPVDRHLTFRDLDDRELLVAASHVRADPRVWERVGADVRTSMAAGARVDEWTQRFFAAGGVGTA